jgi:hypothetical protein
MQGITIKYLQEYLKAKDHNPELKHKVFLKLSEEIGELAKATRSILGRVYYVILAPPDI